MRDFRYIPAFAQVDSDISEHTMSSEASESPKEPASQSGETRPEEFDLRRLSPSLSDIYWDCVLEGLDIGDAGPSTVDDRERDEAFEAFLRNEISYNDYARIAGEELLGAEESEDDVEDGEADLGSISRTDQLTFMEVENAAVDEEDEKEEGDRYEEEEDEEIGVVPNAAWPRERRFKKPVPTNLMRTLMQSVPDDLRNQLVVNNGDFPVVKEKEIKEPRQVGKKMGLAHALIGQALITYANGNAADAVKMLLEVIRQNPRNPEAYLQASQMFSEMGKLLEGLQYGLLGAHLSSKTPASNWGHLGDLAVRLDRTEEAAACFNRAIQRDPTNWAYYEKRINVLDKLGFTSLAMSTRLMAANSVDPRVSNVDFRWFEELIKSVAEFYIAVNNEGKAIAALEAFVIRSHQFGLYSVEQHHLLLGLWMKQEKYEEVAKSIFALCTGIEPFNNDGTPSMEVCWSNTSFHIEGWNPFHVDRYKIDPSVPTLIVANLAICLIHVRRSQSVESLVEHLVKRHISPDDESAYLDIARAYAATNQFQLCHLYVQILNQLDLFVDNPETWYLTGVTYQAKNMMNDATNFYERVLSMHPQHVDARINLSNIQESLGQSDKALETLQGHDLDLCTRLPDERILIRQAEILYEKKDWCQYVRCLRMLLTPHFYKTHLGKVVVRSRKKSQKLGLDNVLRNAAIVALRGTAWEQFVKRLGAVAFREERNLDDLNGTQLHDYAFRLMEVLHDQKRYQDMLCVCCYAFLQTKINSTKDTFLNLLFFSAVRADNWTLAFEYIRWFHQNALVFSSTMGKDRAQHFTRIYNAMNFVFCHSQNVSYHRYIMRALVRTPGNHALQMISGNNSLITGSYRHALGEYMKVWDCGSNRNDPMLSMLIGLTFIHISCKKDISSRHMLALRGFAFMRQYEKLRGPCQEALYNIGRMFHQMGMTFMAVHFYEKLLEDSQAPKVWVIDEATGTRRAEVKEEYDLKPLAAHNLALIYERYGNIGKARAVLEKFCVV
uniref:TPR_REGION domain-containing protein n=1 Tax=Steinernema glaseri TaxID=37863 RepID=A0A1I7ZQD1_9BILA